MKDKLFKKKELLILIIIVVAAVVVIFLFPRYQGNIAVVYYDSAVVREIRLDRDGIYEIDADLPVTLEVADGKIRFIHAQCPDLLCEGFGFIGNEAETAICMPARVAVIIKSSEN